jgi:hypothetical protein
MGAVVPIVLCFLLLPAVFLANKETEALPPGVVAHSRTGVMNFEQSYFIICALTANEDEYVEEWIKYHLHIGFNRIHLLDNNVNQSTALAMVSYKYFENVRTKHMPGANKHMGAYYKCAKPYMGANVWAAFIDIDEFIVLHHHRNIREALKDMVPAGGALSLNRVLFGSNGHVLATPGPVLSRFTARSRQLDPLVKTITYMPHTLKVFPHFSVLKSPHERMDPEGRPLPKASTMNRSPSEEVAAIYHYHLKSQEEYRKKRLMSNSTLAQIVRSGGIIPPSVEAAIVREFRRIDQDANGMQDTRAWDVYKKISK